MSNSESGGCGGCLSIIILVIIMWALVYGVTFDGKHCGLGLSEDTGVSIICEEVQ